MKIPRRSHVLALALFALLGCGKDGAMPEGRHAGTRMEADLPSAATPMEAPAPADQATAAVPSRVANGAAAGMARKIVYKADIQLVCEELSAIAQRLESLVAASGGFVADAQLIGSLGEPRWGVWKLRVPTGRFDGLLAEIKKLAEVRSARITSDDVSEEYYDVEARIRNKQQEETRLLRLLDDRTAELDDVLAVEREIARVREEVERAQARLRVLANLTDLATITVRVDEVRNYQPESTPTFRTRLARDFQQSIDTLVGAAQAVVIGLAVAAPWGAVLSVPPLALAALLRRGRKH